MKFAFKNSIGVMLLRIVFGCYLLVTFVSTVVQLYTEYTYVEDEVITELANVGRSFEEALASALWAYDPGAINSILSGMAKVEAIAGVEVKSSEGKTEANSGFFTESISGSRPLTSIVSNGIHASEIALMINGEEHVVYQYKLNIYYDKLLGQPQQLIGSADIYASRTTVVQRFKDSLILILISAVVKTTALWVIFLYFSRRLLSRPLLDLTKASSSLAGDVAHSEEVSRRLEEKANSSSRNELQHLARSFLNMRNNVLDKIENLDALNHFAVALTQTKTHNAIYERLFHQLVKTFGAEGAVVIDNKNKIVWASEEEGAERALKNTLQSEENDFRLDVIRGNRDIVYNEVSLHGKGSSADGKVSAISMPLLYIPISLNAQNHKEIWVLGTIIKARRSHDGKLNEESLSFLQVLSNLVSATLINLEQKEVIENQNRYLEARVLERTQALTEENKELRQMTVRDPVTRLPNRTLYIDRLHHMIEFAVRENRRFAVLSIEFSQLDDWNSAFDTETVDNVLEEIGRRFSSALRKSDTLARISKQELGAILIGNNIESSIEYVLARMQSTLHDTIVTSDGHSFLPTAKIGVSFFPDQGVEAEKLLRKSNIALQQAKRSGKDYFMYETHANTEDDEFLHFVFELENAIERSQLRLHFQPVVDFKTKRPLYYEALLRWEHPARGLVPPGLFIPHADRTGFISDITFWVATEVAKLASQWQNDGIHEVISLNISSRVFTLPDLPERLADIFNQFDVQMDTIKLEIPESALSAHPDNAILMLKNLRQKGFLLSIDDFGLGQTSIALLTRLPVQEIKIDRSFITDNMQQNLDIVNASIKLAHSLNITVVAEGVENHQTLKILQEHYCDAAQGYHICRPDDVLVIEKWISDCEDHGLGFLPKS
ncbi:MAG: EAL domain-containing protein [Agarilytica sp.]